MGPWFETIGVILIAVLGVFLGRTFSRLKPPYWLFGYFLPLSLVILLITARFMPDGNLSPWLFYFGAGRAKFVVVALAVTMGLVTPLSRLVNIYEKVLVCLLIAVFVGYFCVLPFLAPAFVADELSNIETMLDAKGICFQSTDYTCAPAAAVTILRKLGLDAHEGEIARLSHSNPVTGTLPHSLYRAIRNRYEADGLECRYRHFDSISQLKEAGLTLTMIRDALFLDHCVAVLDVSEDGVLVGDPVDGQRLISREQFRKIWRFSGIVLKREQTHHI